MHRHAGLVRGLLPVPWPRCPRPTRPHIVAAAHQRQQADRGHGSQYAGDSGTRSERQIRPAVIAGRPVTAVLRMAMRLKAPLMSPYDSRAVESYVVIARRIASISATSASGSASAAAGVDAHLSMTRPAPRQTLHVPAHDHHLHSASGFGEPRPQLGMLRAPRADPALRLVLRLERSRHQDVPGRRDRSWPQGWQAARVEE